MATINVRVDEKVKTQANELFNELGIDMSTAMNLFLRQAIRTGGIPFEIKRNPDTVQAMAEAKAIKEGKITAKAYSNVDDLFDDLKKEDD